MEAKEVEELHWQDVPLCSLEQQKAPEASLIILIPGYKLNYFSRIRVPEIANNIYILYPGISIAVEVYNIMLKYNCFFPQ
jgi:hypothetical protein